MLLIYSNYITVLRWIWQLHSKMEIVAFLKYLDVLVIYSWEGWCVLDRDESSVITVKNNSAAVKSHTSTWILVGCMAAAERTHWPERDRARYTANISHSTHLRQLADTHPQLCEMKSLRRVITENCHVRLMHTILNEKVLPKLLQGVLL